MTWDEYDVWSEHSVRGYAAQQVAAGVQGDAEATAYARRQLAELLPSGIATPLHHQWTVRDAGDGDAQVGWLWLRVRPLAGQVEAYVFDVEVAEHARGRGLGRATMLAAEQAARDLGADLVRLNVFAPNTAARGLYRSLGYTVESDLLTRWLDGRRELRELPGGDPAARAACEGLGFELTAQLMVKSL